MKYKYTGDTFKIDGVPVIHNGQILTIDNTGTIINNTTDLIIDKYNLPLAQHLIEMSNVICENDDLDDDMVEHPPHYTQGNIECIDAMISAYGVNAVMHFCQCNAFKYLWRFQHKNKTEDLDKSLWYINKYKELYQKK